MQSHVCHRELSVTLREKGPQELAVTERHVAPQGEGQALRLVPKCSLHSDGNRGR